MKLLVEEYPYSVADVADVLDGLCTLQDIDNKISVSYVGYFYNPKIKDCVFILPKVIVNEAGMAFGKYNPAEIIDLDNSPLEAYELKFLYELSVWIHRAIVVFKNTHANSSIVLHRLIEAEGGGSKKKSNTLLDIILSLIRFNKENKSFFTFVLKNIHSGYNKINWGKTISRTSAIVDCEAPIYVSPVNKKRQINFDEELIVIFFSILEYISNRFGFKTEIPFGFKLIKGSQFEKYLNGYGSKRLREIKYKYFSDTAVRLWELCYAFFDKTYQININASQSEYLLVKSFNIVFEAIIDELIGDKDIPLGLKEQIDGKRVDHFYSYDGLIVDKDKDNDIYYIGDSKYYKIGSNPGEESVYKQYTYARNVIQWNLDIFLSDNENARSDKGRFGDIKLLDEVTEGFNVIPNFFISAKIDPLTLSYKDRTERRESATYVSRKFNNRLYDRDTLIVSHYDVNFLFVIALYARDNSSAKAAWKDSVRSMFRREIQSMLKDKFKFYAMAAHPDVDAAEYFRSHFQETLGKTFRPYESNRVFSLALESDGRFDEENNELLRRLEANFYVVPIELGSNPSERLLKRKEEVGTVDSPDGKKGMFLTAMVTKTDLQWPQFANHTATQYTMRKITIFNIMDVAYLLPMVNGRIDGYYRVERMTIGNRNGQVCLNFVLGDFTLLGDKKVSIYGSKMRPGELLSYSAVQKLYDE